MVVDYHVVPETELESCMTGLSHLSNSQRDDFPFLRLKIPDFSELAGNLVYVVSSRAANTYETPISKKKKNSRKYLKFSREEAHKKRK